MFSVFRSYQRQGLDMTQYKKLSPVEANGYDQPETNGACQTGRGFPWKVAFIMATLIALAEGGYLSYVVSHRMTESGERAARPKTFVPQCKQPARIGRQVHG